MLLEFRTVKNNKAVIDVEQIGGMRADRGGTLVYLKSGRWIRLRGKLREVRNKWEDAREATKAEHAKTEVDRFLDRMDRLMVELPQGQPLNALTEDERPRAMKAGAGLMQQVEDLQAIVRGLLDAAKGAYRKHCLGDTDIGWNELSDKLQAALCEAMGDKGFQHWLGEVAGTAEAKEAKEHKDG